MIHKDCFAYISEKPNGCSCLKELYCAKENCKFYKPKTVMSSLRKLGEK